MIRVADYIFRYLADYGVKNVFLVTGGGAMHLNDALNKEKRIKYICNHHEQGCSIAAEGYARTSGKLAVVSVTSGPGGTNTLTGVIGQWVDSVPVLYISGQVKFETTIASVPGSGLRQLGDQEINIVDIVRPVTKYAAMVTDPKNIKRELEKAIHEAVSGRPGPVWLDIPLDIQGALIDESKLKGYKTQEKLVKASKKYVSEVVEALGKSKQPLFVAGHGIRISKAQSEFIKLVKATGMPVVTTFNGFDLIESNSNNFVGRIGTLGSRGGNFALQNSDLLICLGTRNNIRQVGYAWSTFAKNAKVVLVDIDKAELNKKTIKGDIRVHSDVGYFMSELTKSLKNKYKTDKEWLNWCLKRKHKYPVVLGEYCKMDAKCVHPYFFFDMLTELLNKNSVVVSGNGTACVAMFQAGKVKKGQRIFWNSGCASMGYALPASIGAAVASGKEVFCIEGDGSLQMNIQELQTIKHNKLPIKVFILNNQGYRSIEQTQSSFFKADYIGCNCDSGVSFPDYSKLADLYEMKYFRLDSSENMDKRIKQVISCKGPAICEVVLNREYIFSPKQASQRMPDGTIVSRPLEDLFPFLSREEIKSNMINGKNEYK